MGVLSFRVMRPSEGTPVTTAAAAPHVVVRWELSLLPKWVIVLFGSLALTLALYAVAVRRANATRVLFGLKARLRAIGSMAPQ